MPHLPVDNIHLIYKPVGDLLPGDRLVNLGKVVETRLDGAFIHVQVQVQRWSSVTGLLIPTLVDHHFHLADELIVHD